MSHDGSGLLVVVGAAVDPYMCKITNNFLGANYFLSFFLRLLFFIAAVIVVVVAAVDPYTCKITNNFLGANFFLSFFLRAPATRKKAHWKKAPRPLLRHHHHYY